MTDTEVAKEVKAMIRFYEKRGANWLMAAEFTLAKHHTPRSDGRICRHVCGACRHSERAAQRRQRA